MPCDWTKTEYDSWEDCESKKGAAYCMKIKKQLEGASAKTQTGNQTRIAVFSEPIHVIDDSHCCLRVNAVIAKEGVYDFPEGPNGEMIPCLWSKSELLKATRTARSAKITIFEHPPNRVITAQQEMFGIVEKPFFDRNKIRGILNFDKTLCPSEWLEEIRLAEAKKGPPKDVSMGFYFNSDFTPGIWHGIPYQMVMRDIVIDHVAAGVLKGRCSFPDCGIGGISRTSMAAFTKLSVKSLGGKKQMSEETTKDEHGCIIGKEKWDETEQKCVPLPSESAQEEPAVQPEVTHDEHGCVIGKEEWDGEKCVPLQSTEEQASEGESPTLEESPAPPETGKDDLDEHGCYKDRETWDETTKRCIPNLAPDEESPTAEDHSNDPVTEANAAALIARSKSLLKMKHDRDVERTRASRWHPT